MAEKKLILHNLMCVHDALKQAKDACDGCVHFASEEGITVSKEFIYAYFAPEEIERTPMFDQYEALSARYGSTKFFAYDERV